jgi:hypothetical protein
VAVDGRSLADSRASTSSAGERAFLSDHFAGKGDALAALQLAPELAVSLARAARAVPGGLADLTFLECIADANEHDVILLLRIIRYHY